MTELTCTATVAVLLLRIMLARIQERSKSKRSRNRIVHRPRLDTCVHLRILTDEKQFRRYFRIDTQAFEFLLHIIAPKLVANDQMARLRTTFQSISPSDKLQMTLCWFAGHGYQTTRTNYRISVSYFYHIVWQVVNVINEATAEELLIKFPKNGQEAMKMADDFQSLSSSGVVNGCIGCVDGWLCPIKVPHKNEVGKVTSFFSGHYQTYGVNVQACVDSESRFTAFSASCPGGMGDALAFTRWKLSELVTRVCNETLRDYRRTLYIIGDNAYTNSRYCITPYTQPQITSPYHDSYNFHASQLRIRVEMAFGILVRKWGMLQKPLEIKLKNLGKLLNAIFRMHNFYITMRKRRDPCYSINLDDDYIALLGLTNRGGQEMYPSSDVTSEIHVESDVVRTALRRHIESNNILRPQYNTARRVNEDADA